jgi:phosphatidate cytidylyltransferase
MDQILKSEIFKRFASGIILGFCFFGAYIHSAILFSFILLAILLIILFFEWPLLIPYRGLWFFILSFFYPTLPILILIFFNQTYRTQDILFPIYPFIVSWVADTFAYIVGKATGKHKICPTISPGKSWEGLFGGFVGVTIFNMLFLPGIKILPFYNFVNTLAQVLLFSGFITIIAFLGDIFISSLKRKSNLKDAGNLLPGHGGLLDRFNSVFAVTLVIALILLTTI